VLVLAAIAIPVLSSPSLQRKAPSAVVAPVKRIGEQLMSRYVLPLEMIGILLTGALLGAVVIAMRDEPEVELPARRAAARSAEPEEAMSLP
jgi:NADH:ubiquinone oxidoreductase subunit 6 (subunit J)